LFVVDPVRDRPTQLWVDEVMDVDPYGSTGGLPFDTAVGVLADHLFLFGVNADHRITRGRELGGEAVQVTELAVPVRAGSALFHLRW
jgi:hypothetical protein